MSRITPRRDVRQPAQGSDASRTSAAPDPGLHAARPGKVRFVLGIGLASTASGGEVAELARRVLDRAGVGLDAVAVVATRERFVTDGRLGLGPPVVGVDDAVLVADHPAPPRAGVAARFPARVAEGCALAAAGPGADLVVGTTRSAHATAALARTVHAPGSEPVPQAPPA